jgi:uroporphyrinogen-III synthase
MPGHKVLVTRQIEQSVEFINKLSFNRFYPFVIPMIKTVPVQLQQTDITYDFIIITSTNTCECLRPYLDNLKYKRAIAVGEKTRIAMEMAGFRDVEVPGLFSQKGIIEYLSGEEIKNKTFLLPGAMERPDDLIKFLMEHGGKVEAQTVYITEKVCYENGYLVDFLNQIHIDAVTFFSPSAAKSFFSQITFSDIRKIPIFVSIGPSTSDYLLSIGINSVCPKTNFTADGVIDLLIDIFKK